MLVSWHLCGIESLLSATFSHAHSTSPSSSSISSVPSMFTSIQAAMAKAGENEVKASSSTKVCSEKRKSSGGDTSSDGPQSGQKPAKDNTSPPSSKKPKSGRASTRSGGPRACPNRATDTSFVPRGQREPASSNENAYSNGPQSHQEQAAMASSATLEWMRTGSVTREWITSSAAPGWMQEWATARRRPPGALDSDLPMDFSDPRLREYFQNSWQAPTASPASTTSSMALGWSDPPTPRSPCIFVEPDPQRSPPVHFSQPLPLEQVLLPLPTPHSGPAPCWQAVSNSTHSPGQLPPCQPVSQKPAMATRCRPEYGQQGVLVPRRPGDELLIPISEQSGYLPSHSLPERPSYRTALSIPERPRFPSILPTSEPFGHAPSQLISGPDGFALGLPPPPCSMCPPPFDSLTSPNLPPPTAEAVEVDEGFFEDPPILPAIKPLLNAAKPNHMLASSPALAGAVSSCPSPSRAWTPNNTRLNPVSDRDLNPHESMTSSESLNQILTTTLPSLVPVKSRAWVHGSPLSLPPPVEVPYGSTPMVREGGRIVNYKPLTLA
ncbi:hypothetical protein, variant [Phialophora macrospora]|uniref:Uncharacterized protein n=1 Tax=Phialophora macrospora TaxID=1851006 RepID=A0A0D2DJX2_9EURO|nr:hypothetical protein, variant [Phialophora macrospora]